MPTLIGDVGLKTRSMFRKRSGRPRSGISSGGRDAERREGDDRRPPRQPPVAAQARGERERRGDAPASPPAKK